MMRITVLGCSTPLPKFDEPCSGYLLRNNDETETILLDCGSGVFPALTERADPRNLSAVVISHMHPDHSADLITLSNWALNSEEPPKLRIIGPPGWDRHLNGFISEDLSEDLVRDLFAVEYFEDNSTIDLGSFRLTSRLVQHSVTTYGVRIEDKDSKFAYSGDSGVCLSLEELARGVDVFLCEAGAKEPGDFHMTIQQATDLARRAGVKRLLITHVPAGVDVTRPLPEGDFPVDVVKVHSEWLVGDKDG